MEKGDFVRIRYTGRLESGEIFDLTDEEIAKKEKIYSPKVKYGPIPVIVGAGFVIPGLDREIEKMEVNEKRSFTVAAKDAFGERNADLIKVVPQKAFRDQKVEPKQGMIVDFGGMKGRIQSVSGGRVTVDFNNPLAGKNLMYEVEVVEKIENTKDQVKAVFDFFGAFDADVNIEGKEAIISVVLTHDMKQKLSNIVLENVKGIEKVTFKESYTKGNKNENINQLANRMNKK